MLRPTSTGSDIVVDDMANIDQVFSDDDLVDVDALQAEVRALKEHVRTLMLEIAGSFSTYYRQFIEKKNAFSEAPCDQPFL